jgi:predicted dienelactone hydrolase
MKRNRIAVIVLVVLVMAAPALAQSDDTSIFFPPPSGEYPVGQLLYIFADPERDEVFTDDSADQRAIAVTVYYPAAPTDNAATAPYIPEAAAQNFTNTTHLPPPVIGMFSTHSYPAAPAAEGAFPVLLFSPGFGTPDVFYTSLLEEIASHGYIVARISHTYSVGATIFPDGDVIASNEAGSDLNTDESRDGILKVWVTDQEFTLDELEHLNGDDPLLAGKLDLEHVGSFGHSFGGATAVETAYEDSRIDAAINMDGSQFGEVAEAGLDRPIMLMRSTEQPEPTDEELEAAGITREELAAEMEKANQSWNDLLSQSPNAYHFILTGSSHMTYATDLALAAPSLSFMLPPEVIGTIEGSHAYEIISAYVVAFFDQYVKGDEAAALDSLAADYPEVTFEAR